MGESAREPTPAGDSMILRQLSYRSGGRGSRLNIVVF